MRAFRVVVTGHGPIAASLLVSAKMIAGRLFDTVAVPLEAGMTPEDYDLRLAAAVGPGRALVLCDLWGGTPHNRAQLLAGKSGRVICLAGVNLDMVLEAVLAAGELNAALVARVAEAGRRGIVESGHRATPSVRP